MNSSYSFAFLLLIIGLINAQDYVFEEKPRDAKVFVNVYDHPKTGFSCVGKKSGEYYADPETNCAVYYICVANQFNKLSPISFACPNGTIFSQATRVCNSHEQVSCDLATRYYQNSGDLNYEHDNDSGNHNQNNYNQPWQSSSSRGSANAPQTRPRQPQVITTTTTTTSKPEIRAVPITRSPNRLNSILSNRRSNTRLPPQNFVPSSFLPITTSTTSTTTTTTTTAKPKTTAGPPVDYVYEYVDYGNEAPLNPNQPSSAKPPSNRN